MKTAQEKFIEGTKLTSEELKSLDDVDKCRYVVSTYFKTGFNASDVTGKLNELLPGCHYNPIEVYDWLKDFYGEPNSI